MLEEFEEEMALILEKKKLFTDYPEVLEIAIRQWYDMLPDNIIESGSDEHLSELLYELVFGA